MRPTVFSMLSLACALFSGCASPTTVQMRTGRDAMKQAWRDAADSNWEVCAMNLSSTLQHMREGVELKPVHKTKSGEVDLAPYLAAMESGPWSNLRAASRGHNLAAFKTAYVATAQACTACHAAAGRPNVNLRLPDEANIRQ